MSNIGRVIGTWGLLKPRQKPNGYQRVSYTASDGRQKDVYIHRLVARNFIPNPLNQQTVNHKNEDKSDNRVCNLEWMSVKDNNNYGTARARAFTTRVRHGDSGAPRKIYLEKRGQVEEFLSIRRAAKKIGVSDSSVSAVVSGKTLSVKGWHLPSVTNFGKGERRITLCKGGETHTWDSLAEASRHIGCVSSSLSILLKGGVRSVHGWHLPEVKDYGKEAHRRIVCLTKDGIVREWQSLRQAAREIGSSPGNLWVLLKSKSGTKHVKGWRIVKNQSI